MSILFKATYELYGMMHFMIPEKFLSPYNPQETEKRIYKLWEESGFFDPDVCIKKEVTAQDATPFTIIMPPPNVTGILHMGHALMLTLEDILIRFKRMQGFRTLWIPGTDHAAIATQSKVEKEIYKKEKQSRHDLGREEFLKRVDSFAQESHDTIVSQIKVLGSSCDWSREAFTLDQKRNEAVNTVFKMMYDQGLIYRANKIINWDPKGQTTISDDEIVHEERKAKMYTFKYSKDFPISISTTRPETKVGDTAVAVHPEDTRYKDYIGKTYSITFCGVPLDIKIVADEGVDKEFGTGALGVTPAHSHADWDIAQKNNLPVKQVINEYAKMTVGGDNILGKKTTDARDVIVEWLKKENLLEKEEDITQNISTAERTGGIVEPLPKLQWFVDVNKEFTLPHSDISGIESGSTTTLKKIMIKVVENGQTKIIPEHFNKTYFHWINNLRDWCISRQIWYGHRIPVWYKGEEVFVGEKAPGTEWTQDSDTLDTWFSSGIWTFSTLGWPHATKATQGKPGEKNDLDIYHPTDVLETGHEILFFWVARMILMTGFCLGTIPFKTVYLHGTVRDAKGIKMSKSLGNGIDPMDIAEKFGSDAGRMALVIGNTPGTDTRISEDKIKGYKNFANKIWNITRFVLNSIEDFDQKNKPELGPEDAKILTELKTTSVEITSDIEQYRMYMAGEKIYHYIWHTFADVIIEQSKPTLSGTDMDAKKSKQWMLYEVLTTSLKLLHPFMPFVTEEIWGLLPQNKDKDLLMIQKWPA